MTFVWSVLTFVATIFSLVLLAILIAAIVMYVQDKNSDNAIRRNYPVIGRFRDWFSNLGEYFRQYFFAMDREELPFNRAQRDWIKEAAEHDHNTVAFGSTRPIDAPGTPIFVNAAFPPLANTPEPAQDLVIGPDAREPYDAPSFFNISGMSYGALSAPAVTALSEGAAKAGVWMNTGEGGLSPYHLKGGCDIVFQIGTAKYGVRRPDGTLDDEKLAKVAAHPQVKMLEIKLAQGAKPGHGGILPGEKVTAEIAEIRGIPEDKESLSPNRHVEVNDWDELLDFIAHVREVSGLPTGIKTVMGDEAGFADLFTRINARGADSAPDFITIDGGEGGTGAAPMPLIDLVGVSIREALPKVVMMRNAAGLQNRIRIIASGKLVNPSDVAWAMCAGADFVVSARGFMFGLGCIQALKCNKNSCPTGITTHDPELQKGLVVHEKAERVAQYARSLITSVEEIAHSVGVDGPRALQPQHVRVVEPNGQSVSLARIMKGYNLPTAS